MGYIIAITNNKGGCGKTTTTCNLADALGRQNKQVLVIDMDPQCNATSKLFPKSIAIRTSIYDLLEPKKENRTDIANFIYATEYRNVSIIPNIDITSNLEPELILKAPESFFKLNNILRPYAIKNFDFTLIDNPPNMGTFVLCSLFTSDFVIVPVKAGSMDSIEGLLKATQLINDVQTKSNNNLRFLRILINCVDGRTAISKAIVERIYKTFRENQIFKTEIPVNTSFEKAESKKQTIFQIDGTSKGARSFRLLSKELITILNENKNG